MKKKGFRVFIGILLLSSCASLNRPVIYDTDQLIFSNGDIEVDYRIGSSVYYLKITNLTERLVYIDPDSLVVISPEGEARSLYARAPSDSIPPEAYVIYNCNQLTFFKTDLDGPFLFSGEKIKKYISNSNDLDELKGSVIRFYIPYEIEGEKKAAFIKVPLPFLKEQ
ncbi:hypothetical protein [Spirochaeta isovalerica]|uniref:Lipoprotein n=1 Tax=Spirochaeta isovalerica TaxID=150 RepID=A0A841R5T3_9SPIO|nr:hypothetical protein [Spirochaeta isovalerica]MBB6479196.1 hypothetical protein [Spirochaeta isovalerica]